MRAYYISGAEDIEMNKMPFLALGSPASKAITRQPDKDYDRGMIREPREGSYRQTGDH